MTKYSILYNTQSIVQAAGANKDKKDILVTVGIILLVILAITFLNSSKKSIPLEIENTYDRDIEHPFIKDIEQPFVKDIEQPFVKDIEQPIIKDIEQPIVNAFDPRKTHNVIQSQRPIVKKNDSKQIPHGVVNPNVSEYGTV